MIAKCACQLCSQKIEFETDLFQLGMTATCPNCGTETILFISSGAHQATSDGNSDNIFTNGRVTVTPSLLKVGLSTFSISAISSFRVVVIPPSQRKIERLTILGVLILSFGIFTLACNAASDHHSVGAQIFGWVLICIAGLILTLVVFAKSSREFSFKITGKPIFGLNISTTGGEKTIITSPEIGTVDAIGDALQKAISKRDIA